jgi:SecD/SecF fusion protein
MQNKGAIQFFAILLTLACIYHLSFTFVTNRTEAEALEMAGGDVARQQAYLDSIGGSEVVWNIGLASYTYAEAKKHEIGLGLDLRGGINVTLSVSKGDLLRGLVKNPEDPSFAKALELTLAQEKGSQDNFMTLFVRNFEQVNPGASLSAPNLFGHSGQKMINGRMTNAEVEQLLIQEAAMAVDRTFEVLTSRIDNFGLTQPIIQRLQGSDRIRVELPGVQNEKRVRELLEAPAKLEFWETLEAGEVLGSNNLQKLSDAVKRHVALGKTEEVASDTTATADTLATVTNDTNAVATETPADTNETALQSDSLGAATDDPLFAIFAPNVVNSEGFNGVPPGPVLGSVAGIHKERFLEFMALPEVKRILPPQIKISFGFKQDETGRWPVYALRNTADGQAALSGDVVIDANFQPDSKTGGYEVVMNMNAEGSSAWASLTGKNKGKSVAIVLDGVVYSAPTVQDKISGGTSSITGNFSFDEAKTLASVLKSGKLPTKALIEEMAVVGPSLGKQSINAGLTSLALAFVLVLLYMIFYYGKAGMVANVALLANVFFLIGALAAFNTTLTLAGITGIVLTIGMSVDANVLIYERIREELRQGKSLKLALNEGYDKAYRAIIDSNITTMLIALILIFFGAGPVKGFAITLFMGILTSLFTAIFITRLIFEAQLAKKKEISFSSKTTDKLFSNIQFDWIGKRKMFYAISGVLVAISLGGIIFKGFNLGVDLSGGRSYVVKFDNTNISTENVAQALTSAFDGEAPAVKLYGGADAVSIVTKYRLDEDGAEADRAVEETIYNALSGFYATPITMESFIDKNEMGIISSERVGPTMARDVAYKSFWAVIISLVVMFGYILFRFKGWQYGTSAVLALLHDVIILLGIFALFNGILPFSLQVDQAIIAAVLTVIGYSINDTVIIFDRIREYLTEGRKGTMNSYINDALNSTLGRTINTSVTVLVVLISAFLFGGEGIRGLSFAILIGVVVGTYSSLCIAAPLVSDFKAGFSKEKS